MSLVPADHELVEVGFRFVGSWRSVDCKPHKEPWLKYQSGLYAFTIDDDVVYIGLATTLHRRLRNYSRRAFRDLIRPPREAHFGIASAISSGIEVKVYAKIMEGADSAELLVAETLLIRSFNPLWNRTHVPRSLI
jgi:excinuclease UvrABC nuclease subunit